MSYAFDSSAVLGDLIACYRSGCGPITVDFRELAPWIRKGDQFTHQVHPYPAKLIPHIASFFVGCKSLSQEGDPVLDPFCGTGTVALETSLAGRRPIGADANPLALLVARVKTFPYSVGRLRKLSIQVAEDARKYSGAPAMDILNVLHWYTARTKAELEKIAAVVQGISEATEREFFLVCLSSTARKVSYADPGISVPVRLKDKAQYVARHSEAIKDRLAWLGGVDVFDEFLKCCLQNICRVDEANQTMPFRRPMEVAGTDARSLFSQGTGLSSLAGQVPLVVTSPPYGSAQKYVRASSLGLNWTGLATPAQLRSLENASIGREHLRGPSSQEPLPNAQEKFLRSVRKVNPHRAELARTYMVELKQALVEIARIVGMRGHVVLVIGNNEVAGNPMRNDQFCSDVLRGLGFHERLHLLDHIRSRGLMTKRNKTASMISRESVLVFQKE